MTQLIIFGVMALAFVCILGGWWLDSRHEMARRGRFNFW